MIVIPSRRLFEGRLFRLSFYGQILLILLLPAEHASGTALSPSSPLDIPSAATAPQVETFAWQMFVALNWPAAAGVRGVPDQQRKIGDPGATVWETFKRADEVFLEKGVNPGPWNSPWNQRNPTLLTQTAKALTQILSLSGVNQAIGGPITDQRGNLVYYEKAANEISYNYIRNSKLYDGYVQSHTGPIVFPFGALEIKAAWRILTSSDDTSRYHAIPALIRLADGSTRGVKVGLVGLHIIVKTKNAPQWIWATFEQIDNVPPLRDGIPSSFNSPVSTTPINVQTPPGTPTQVARSLLSLSSTVQEINAVWQGSLSGTSWNYYQLIDAQYPTDPKDPATFDGDPTPTILANTTMETYIQPISSCIDCHSTARSFSTQKSDFSFFLLNAQSSRPSLTKQR